MDHVVKHAGLSALIAEGGADRAPAANNPCTKIRMMKASRGIKTTHLLLGSSYKICRTCVASTQPALT